MADNYIVSARKYRPDSFRSIVGQGAMASTLQAAVLSGKLAHAYLFCGPRGVGKTTAARVLAKTINCTNLSPEGEACNECESCRAFNEQRSFNIFELDAASNNSVEDIRQLTEQVMMPPALGRYKVYIIDEVHMLSAAAFNAFLKTLEEPPSYAIFILATTEKHKILPTILSRCQIYDFKRITVPEITAHLKYVAESEGIRAEETALGLIAEKADGGMRDALSMFDRIASFAGGEITYIHALESLNVLDYTYFIRTFTLLRTGDYRELLLLLNELLGKGFEGQTILSGLASFVRDLLVAQHPGTLSLLEKPEAVATAYSQLASQLRVADLFAALKTLVAADQSWRTATNKRLLLELTLLNLSSLFRSDSPLNPPTAPAPLAGTANNAGAGTSSAPAAAPTAQAKAPVATPTTQSASPQPAVTASTPTTTPEESLPQRPQPVHAEATVTSTRPRQLFGSRRRPTAAATEEVTPSAEPAEPEAQAFTEENLQMAWLRFVAKGLTQHQILARQLLSRELPRLTGPTQAVVALPPGAVIHDTIQEIYPQLLSFLRKELHNSSLQLDLREKTTEEQAQVAITPQEKFQKLAEINPAVVKLKDDLSLKFN